MGDRLINDGIRWLLLLVWLIITFICWITTFVKHNTAIEFYYTRYLMGSSLPVARASALALNFNSMLILLPVCRNLISYLRGSFETNEFYRKNIRRQLDKSITFHKLIAYLIIGLVIMHIVAHCFNMQHLYWATQGTDGKSDELSTVLSGLPYPGNTWVNPIQKVSNNPELGLGLLEQVFASTAGWTGIILTIALILMVTSSTEFMRRSYFETFWFSHHLFVLYFAMLIVHGTGGIVRKQTNTAEHDPLLCKDQLNNWNSEECPVPLFAGSSAASWKWCIFPLCVYIVERILRISRTWQDVIVTKVIKHPSKVVELQITKKGFSMQPGQYVFLKCPRISHLQWHPFTMTSAPEEKHFSVHIRRVGDWTEALAKSVGVEQEEPLPAAQLPKIAVDGPFGTASTDIFDYKVAVCVAAGIGVTPFASILKSIQFKLERQDTSLQLQKVYFFWVCSDTQSFEWFMDLLYNLEQYLMEVGRENFLEYAICLTRGWSLSQAKNIYLQEEQELDAITGLMQKTHYGRPRWEPIFSNIKEENKGETIGVFFCGPKSLSHVLHKCCNMYTNRQEGGTVFVYNKENF